MSVTELEAAISSLPPQDFARLRDWFWQRDHELWDKQIEEDSASGKLDHLVHEIEADITGGKVKPLNEVLNGS